jgi:hypothetical protein
MVRSRMVELALIGFCLAVPFQGQETKNSGPSAQARAEMKKSELPLSSLTEFSAIMVGSLVGNIDELHVYRSGNLMRTEMLDGNYMVTNLDSRDTFGVLPDRCVHSAVPSVNTFPFSFFRPGQKAERNLVGSEVVDGHACQVEEITITPEQGQPRKMKFWDATDLSGFPVKIEVQRVMGAPVTITYKDVKIGRPDAALFQHPAKCGPAPQKGKKSPAKPGTSSAPPPKKL